MTIVWTRVVMEVMVVVRNSWILSVCVCNTHIHYFFKSLFFNIDLRERHRFVIPTKLPGQSHTYITF